MIRFRNVQSVIFFTAFTGGSERTFQVVSKRLKHHHYEAHLYAYSYEDYRFVCLPTPIRYTKTEYLTMQDVARRLLILNRMLSCLDDVEYQDD